MGNERRGVGGALRRLADGALRIPMRGRGVGSLNVAAAAAIALYQLTFARAPSRVAPGTATRGRRSGLLLVDPVGPGQVGSSLRTAWALGWNRAVLADTHGAWFTRDRAIHAQGRGAARRHKNPIRVVPFDPAAGATSPALIVTLAGVGPPLWRAALPAGVSVVVVPDETVDASRETACTTNSPLLRVTLGTPAIPVPYDYRLVTAIVLAEVARRIGWRTSASVR